MGSVSPDRGKKPDKQLDLFEREKALILNSIDDLVVFHNPEMKILWTNRAAEVSVNSPPGGLVGRRCWEIWHQRNTPCAGCPVVLTLGTGEPHLDEIRSPDGREWFIRSYPIKNDDGTLKGIVELCQDITERKRVERALKESEERFRATFDQAAVGMTHVDLESRFIRVNQKFCDIAGYSREELLARCVGDVTYAPDMPEESDLIRRIRAGEFDTFSREKRYLRKDLPSARALPGICTRKRARASFWTSLLRCCSEVLSLSRT